MSRDHEAPPDEPQEFEAEDSSVPKHLYHYTNATGLLGILKSKTIWATNAEYLNDVSELRMARESAQNALLDFAELGTLAGQLGRALLTRIKETEGIPLYVASLSQVADDLNQWRAYTGGVEPGFSIEFDGAVLNKLDVPFELIQCQYTELEHQNLVASPINAMYTEVVERGSVDSLRPSFGERLLRILPACKSWAFRAEEEWRLVAPDYELRTAGISVEFQARRSLLTPYVAVELASNDYPNINPICEVMVGPGPHQDLSRAAAARCLEELNLRDITVTTSTVPYRDW